MLIGSIDKWWIGWLKPMRSYKDNKNFNCFLLFEAFCIAHVFVAKGLEGYSREERKEEKNKKENKQSSSCEPWNWVLRKVVKKYEAFVLNLQTLAACMVLEPAEGSSADGRPAYMNDISYVWIDRQHSNYPNYCLCCGRQKSVVLPPLTIDMHVYNCVQHI